MDLKHLFLFVTTLVVYVFGQFKPPARFYLTNPQNPAEHTELDDDFTGIDPKVRTVLITHGSFADINIPTMTPMATEFHKKGRYNVILVDWHDIASGMYDAKVTKTTFVGCYIGEFLIRMSNHTGLPFDRMHLVANTLGAHVFGFAGLRVQQDSHMVERITALDPGNPEFSAYRMNHYDHILNKTDARSVVVLHTDGGGMGMSEPIGTVDFYANCGTRVQPSCRNSGRACSSSVALRYFIESINSIRYSGQKCARASCQDNSCNILNRIIFGPDIPATANGIYHFKTT